MTLENDMAMFCSGKETWKGKLSEFLSNELKLIKSDFTGELNISVNQGGVRFITKSETLK